MGPDTPLRGGSRGFTLIELMVIIVLMGIVAGWVVVDYRGVTERQRLQSVVREFVGVYRETRARAVKERRLCMLEIDMENQRYRVLVYPHTDAMGRYVRASDGEVLDADWVEEQVENRQWTNIDPRVSIVDAEAPGADGNEKFDEFYWLQFREDGTLPPHILHFETARSHLQMSIEIEELTGNVTVKPGFVEFYSPQPEEFNSLEGGGSIGK